MSKLQEKIYAILENPQLAGLATLTEDIKPWVRYVMIATSKDLTIRLASFVNARKVSQIKKNPEVHLTCGITDPQTITPYLQIQGKAVLTTDKDQRHQFWNESLEQIFDGPDDPNYGIIVIKPYRIEYCAPGTFEPEIWVTH